MLEELHHLECYYLNYTYAIHFNQVFITYSISAPGTNAPNSKASSACEQ